MARRVPRGPPPQDHVHARPLLGEAAARRRRGHSAAPPVVAAGTRGCPPGHVRGGLALSVSGGTRGTRKEAAIAASFFPLSHRATPPRPTPSPLECAACEAAGAARTLVPLWNVLYVYSTGGVGWEGRYGTVASGLGGFAKGVGNPPLRGGCRRVWLDGDAWPPPAPAPDARPPQTSSPARCCRAPRPCRMRPRAFELFLRCRPAGSEALPPPTPAARTHHPLPPPTPPVPPVPPPRPRRLGRPCRSHAPPLPCRRVPRRLGCRAGGAPCPTEPPPCARCDISRDRPRSGCRCGCLSQQQAPRRPPPPPTFDAPDQPLSSLLPTATWSLSYPFPPPRSVCQSLWRSAPVTAPGWSYPRASPLSRLLPPPPSAITARPRNKTTTAGPRRVRAAALLHI